MKKIENNEIKQIQLSILKFVHEFCIENSINYSLCGGTLIGAIRHKGYIPWDDDVDIMMPRPDYERFVELFNSKKFENYRVISSDLYKEYFSPHAKVMDTRTFLDEKYDRKVMALCANIDVFPVDGLPDDKVKRDRYWFRIFKIRNLNTVVYAKNLVSEHGFKKIVRRILFVFFKLLPANFIAKRINKMARKNPFNNSSFVAVSVFGYGRKEEISAKAFDSYIDMDFENLKLKVISGFDIYLSSLYGDYMQLPPEEKRVAKHGFDVYWR